jgi:putative membrane protein
MRALARIALNGIAILVAAWLIPGIDWQGTIWYLLLTGFVIGCINLLVKPLVTLFSIPFIVVTFGLFMLLINGGMLMLAGKLLDGLSIDGWGSAILGGIVVSLFNWGIELFDKD